MLTTDGATADTVGRAETFKGNIICSRNGTRELRHSTQINRNEHASSDMQRKLQVVEEEKEKKEEEEQVEEEEEESRGALPC